MKIPFLFLFKFNIIDNNFIFFLISIYTRSSRYNFTMFLLFLIVLSIVLYFVFSLR